jgi:hypothetical protein
MQKSESIKNIVPAIIKVMQAVKSMEKNSKVGRGNAAYDGTKDQDVKEAFNEALANNGLAVLPTEINENTDVHRWEETNQYGTKQKQSVFTKVTTKYILMHTSGEWVEIAGYGHGVDPQDKSAGKATTYALKNALLYSFLTPVGKIDDTETTHSKDLAVPQNGKQSQAYQVKELTKEVWDTWEGGQIYDHKGKPCIKVNGRKWLLTDKQEKYIREKDPRYQN